MAPSEPVIFVPWLSTEMVMQASKVAAITASRACASSAFASCPMDSLSFVSVPCWNEIRARLDDESNFNGLKHSGAVDRQPRCCR